MSQKNTATSTSKFQLDGRPSMKEAVPLGLQHVLAMFVGNIVPMILVASVANLSVQDATCCSSAACWELPSQPQSSSIPYESEAYRLAPAFPA